MEQVIGVIGLLFLLWVLFGSHEVELSDDTKRFEGIFNVLIVILMAPFLLIGAILGGLGKALAEAVPFFSDVVEEGGKHLRERSREREARKSAERDGTRTPVAERAAKKHEARDPEEANPSRVTRARKRAKETWTRVTSRFRRKDRHQREVEDDPTSAQLANQRTGTESRASHSADSRDRVGVVRAKENEDRTSKKDGADESKSESRLAAAWVAATALFHRKDKQNEKHNKNKEAHERQENQRVATEPSRARADRESAPVHRESRSRDDASVAAKRNEKQEAKHDEEEEKSGFAAESWSTLTTWFRPDEEHDEEQQSAFTAARTKETGQRTEEAPAQRQSESRSEAPQRRFHDQAPRECVADVRLGERETHTDRATGVVHGQRSEEPRENAPTEHRASQESSYRSVRQGRHAPEKHTNDAHGSKDDCATHPAAEALREREAREPAHRAVDTSSRRETETVVTKDRRGKQRIAVVRTAQRERQLNSEERDDSVETDEHASNRTPSAWRKVADALRHTAQRWAERGEAWIRVAHARLTGRHSEYDHEESLHRMRRIGWNTRRRVASMRPHAHA